MTNQFDPDRSLRTLIALMSDDGIREVGSGRAFDLTCEVFEALDKHLRAGGRLPEPWMTRAERSRRVQAQILDTQHETKLADIPQRY